MARNKEWNDLPCSFPELQQRALTQYERLKALYKHTLMDVLALAEMHHIALQLDQPLSDFAQKNQKPTLGSSKKKSLCKGWLMQLCLPLFDEVPRVRKNARGTFRPFPFPLAPANEDFDRSVSLPSLKKRADHSPDASGHSCIDKDHANDQPKKDEKCAARS